MRNIFDDHYADICCGARDYTINGYLFDDRVSAKAVSYEQALSAVFDLVAILRFDVRLSGSKFLAKLVTEYLFDSEYDTVCVIKRIADIDGIQESYVVDCITESIAENVEFVHTASKLFNFELCCGDQPTVDDAVAVIAALSKIYFNHNIADERSRNKSATIGPSRIFS